MMKQVSDVKHNEVPCIVGNANREPDEDACSFPRICGHFEPGHGYDMLFIHGHGLVWIPEVWGWLSGQCHSQPPPSWSVSIPYNMSSCPSSKSIFYSCWLGMTVKERAKFCLRVHYISCCPNSQSLLVLLYLHLARIKIETAKTNWQKFRWISFGQILSLE